MDYVVYGTGYGATLMLLGYAVRTWGPGWRFRDEDERAYSPGVLRSARAAWARFTSGLGAVIATCGVALILLTFVLMMANPGDDISEMVTLVVTGVMLVVVAVWAWMYLDRFGAFGVIRMPEALGGASPAPLRYDNRQRQADQPAAASESDAADADTGDEVDVEEIDTYEPDEDEIAELEARTSKFTTHHPAGDDAEPLVEGEGAVETPEPESEAAGEGHEPEIEGAGERPEPGSDDVEARSTKFEQHHPEVEGYHDSLEDTVVVDEAEEPVASVPAEDDACAESASIEPIAVSDADDAAPEIAPTPQADEVDVDDPDEEALLEETDLPDEVAGDEDSGATPSTGREDALRRLRERQANRRRADDDA